MSLSFQLQLPCQYVLAPARINAKIYSLGKDFGGFNVSQDVLNDPNNRFYDFLHCSGG